MYIICENNSTIHECSSHVYNFIGSYTHVKSRNPTPDHVEALNMSLAQNCSILPFNLSFLVGIWIRNYIQFSQCPAYLPTLGESGY